MSQHIIKVNLESILNYRALLGGPKTKPSRYWTLNAPMNAVTLQLHEEIERVWKKTLLNVKEGFLLFLASSGSCVPGAFPLCDQGVAVPRVMVPPSRAGFTFHLLKNSCPGSSQNVNSRVCSRHKESRESPNLTRVVLSPERTSALGGHDGFLQKTRLKSALFQFYTFDILMTKENE